MPRAAKTKIDLSLSLDLDLVNVAGTVNTEILPLRALDMAASGSARPSPVIRITHTTARDMARICTGREVIHNAPPPSLMSSFAAAVTNET
ncbi:hypothetical protein SRABI98_00698 [Microbacterium sp. Bi98]|nr:hypothetical protein SRABI98_00698 [Microbacterium sp. Bi98]